MSLAIIGYAIFRYKFNKNGFAYSDGYKGNTKRLKEGWYISSASMFSRFYYNIDILILGLLTTKTDVGIYASLGIIYSVLLTGRGFIISAVIPYLGKLLNKPKQLSAQIIFWSSLFVILSFSLLILTKIYGQEIIVLFFGEAYFREDSVPVLFLFLVTFLVLSINLVLPSICLLLEYGKKYQIVTFFAAITNVILNILLIPLYGLVAAASTTLIAEFIVLVGSIYILKTHYIHR